MAPPPTVDKKFIFQVRLEVDAVLPASKTGFTPITKDYKLIVGATELQFIPKVCGCACGKAYVVPLMKVVLNKLVNIPYKTPGMMMQMEEDLHVPLVLKLWVHGKPVEDCFNQIEAMRKLTRGEVIVAGTLDPKAKPSAASLSYFSRDAARKVYDAQQRLGKAVVKGDAEASEKILLGEGGEQGTITLVRKPFGVDMMLEKKDEPPCSVFCQVVTSPSLMLHTTEVPGPNGTVLYRLAFPGGTAGNISNLKVEVPSTVLLATPYENVQNEVHDIRPVKKGGMTKAMTGFSHGVSAGVGRIRRSVSISRAPAPAPTQTAVA